MNFHTKVGIIRAEVPRVELLTGLAEEAAELAQAALKYRRAIDGTNPTPMSAREALEALYEEIGDVALYLGVLDLLDDVTFSSNVPAERMGEKLLRWVERLRGAKV